MKHKAMILMPIFTFVLILSTVAQGGGNHIYQNNGNNNSHNRYTKKATERASVYATDSTLIITSKVLMNKKADYYMITVGVNQIAKTVIEANKKINTRIENASKKIKKLGINQDEIYIDFISNTKLYDHKINGREIIEEFDGFSLRKNIIIKTKRLLDIDRIVDICSEQEIFDIIKIDYVSEDMEKIGKELLDEAVKVIENKKNMFKTTSSTAISKDYRLTYEKSKTYYPKNMYQQYNEAFETTSVNRNYNNNYIKKEARKERTFYYDGIETDFGIDKIIDKIAPVVGIQYVLEIQVIYQLKR
ncbi:MAG: SIMPL domain-containing protein [Flavobacteriales bacterium]